MKVVSVCNQKGGVGKTTTAINLSAYLAIEHQHVLLIDSDPQSNSTSGVGVEPQSVNVGLYDLLMQVHDIDSVITSTSVDNLWIIPSSVHLAGAEVELVSADDREYRLRKIVEKVSGNFDYIIIDCPPSLGLLTVNALAAADGVLVPMQCEYYALEGVSHLVDTIKLVKERLNSKMELLGVLMTMADMRTNLTNQVIQEARSFFKEKVFDTVIPRSIRLSEAPSFGKPIAMYDASSVGAQKYRELALEFMARVNPGQRERVAAGGMSGAAESVG